MTSSLKHAAGGIISAMDNCRLLPAAGMAVLPVLAVRLKYVLVAPDAGAAWPWLFYGDTRAWWKAALVVGLGAWMALHILIRLAGAWRPRFRRFGLLLVAAALTTLASALLSPFPRTAWLGATSLYEGAAVLLGYLVTAWYAAEMVDNGRGRLVVLRLLGLAGLVNAMLGIAEGTGWNFWASAAGRLLMGVGREDAVFRFASAKMAYGTAFQPNHYGMLMAMLTVLAIGMIGTETVRGWLAFWCMVFVGGMAATVFSNSRTAVAVCLVVGCVFIASMVRQKSGRRRPFGKPPSSLIIAGAVIAAVLVLAGGRLVDATAGVAGRLGATFTPQPGFSIQSVRIEGSGLLVAFADDTVRLERRAFADWRIAGTNKMGDAVIPAFIKGEGGWRRVGSLLGRPLALAERRDGGIVLEGDGMRLHFYAAGERLYGVDAKGALYRDIGPARSVTLFGLEKYLGGRGQTWGRALAVVGDRPWFGGGPGSFPLVFPNHDLLARQRFLENVDEDKGHGIWVTFLVQLGVVGCLAHIAPVVFVLARRPWRAGPVGMALTVAIAAYLLSSATNDSTVGVTPVFCLLVGMALSVTGDCVGMEKDGADAD